MDSEKDQKVKRIARFLELGGTMLAEHCKVCGAPRFRYQGKVICPICDVKEEGQEMRLRNQSQKSRFLKPDSTLKKLNPRLSLKKGCRHSGKSPGSG